MSRQTFQTCYIEMRVAVDLAAESLACWEIVSHGSASDWQSKGLKQIPNFASYVSRTSLLTLIIQLYKPLESRSDSYSFYRLIEYAFAEGIISSRKQWLDLVDKLKPAWEKVRHLRHKFYAHLDTGKSPKQLLLEFDITPTDFRALLDAYDMFLQKIARRVGLNPTSIRVREELIRAEIKTMLDALKTRGSHDAV